jgi:hypothetical protein
MGAVYFFYDALGKFLGLGGLNRYSNFKVLENMLVLSFSPSAQVPACALASRMTAQSKTAGQSWAFPEGCGDFFSFAQP